MRKRFLLLVVLSLFGGIGLSGCKPPAPPSAPKSPDIKLSRAA